MLFDLSMTSGFAEWMHLVRECDAYGSVSFVFVVFLLLLLLVVLLVMRRDFVVRISIFSMPRCLGSESPSGLSTGLCVIVVFFGF